MVVSGGGTLTGRCCSDWLAGAGSALSCGAGRLGIGTPPVAARLSASARVTFRGGPSVAGRPIFFACAAAESIRMPPEDSGGGGAVPGGTAFAIIGAGPLLRSAVALLGAFSWLGAGSRRGNGSGAACSLDLF